MTPSRLAACEACRKAKLACDHKQPACTRCERNNNAAICIYRAAPFKRRRTVHPSPSSQESSIRRPRVHSSPPSSQRSNPYPNPGFLGSSSHVTIFNHISPENYEALEAHHGSGNRAMSIGPEPLHDNFLLMQGADMLRQLLNIFPLPAMKDLVMFWLASGANLALAEPFTKQCAEIVDVLFTSLSQDEDWHLAYARRLFQNSRQSLEVDVSSDISIFSAQFLNQNFRWESFGIFLSAVSRATIDVSFFPSLYKDEKSRFNLRRLSTKLSDVALDLCLSLDCLNDLQVVLQYENFIVHSHVDGDQSYHSWSRLGNVISTMFALGYHEDVETTKPRIPPFLSELRRTAWAVTYSADKNVSIFLGRPPRMSRRFCHFQLPMTPKNTGPSSSTDLESITAAWDPNTPISYRAELRWSALCAALKEDILELLGNKHHYADTYKQRADLLGRRAALQWDSVPHGFKLQCSLKECPGSPFERDFFAGVRLNRLHVLFLLRLLVLDTLAEPDAAIVDISEQILALVVEIILLRDQLVNSGTGLIWKVAHYGLPAAGIILLSMLRQHRMLNGSKAPWTKTLMNLGIFVAQIQSGSIVRPGEPNYALISKATQTIEKFLDSLHYEGSQVAAGEAPQVQEDENWAALFGQDLLDFETGFWQNLADHPSLLVPDTALHDLQ